MQGARVRSHGLCILPDLWKAPQTRFPQGPWTAHTPRCPQAAQALLLISLLERGKETTQFTKAAGSLATETGHLHLLSTPKNRPASRKDLCPELTSSRGPPRPRLYRTAWAGPIDSRAC